MAKDTFVMDIQKFTVRSIEDIDLIRRKTTIDVFNGVVRKTPVDTGRARGNWQTTVTKPATEPIDLEDPNGQSAMSETAKVVGQSGILDSVFLANNLPYIGTLEYGGYPNPPKKGSYDPRTGSYTMKSSGGFSKQAPAGMVRITLAEFPQIVKKSEAGTKYGG